MASNDLMCVLASKPASVAQHMTRASELMFTAVQLVPSRESFLEKLGTLNEELYQQMASFLDAFQPLLEGIHSFLVQHDLDDPTRV